MSTRMYRRPTAMGTKKYQKGQKTIKWCKKFIPTNLNNFSRVP